MSLDKPDEHNPDLEQLAGEYVLGTLSGAQRAEVQRRLPDDLPLQTAVDAWEQRLHPLTDLAPPQTPSPVLWTRIARSSHETAYRTTPVAPVRTRWRQRLALWQGISVAGLAATLVLGLLLLTRTAPVHPPTFLVVLVAPQDKAPGWVVQASNPQEIQLIPLGTVEVPPDQALEFWTKADDWQGPVSLGLVKPGETLRVPLDKLPPLQADQLFELTLEKSTGSPIGRPTGPVQFIGRAVKVI